jgi:acyl-CoA dehydrogenase
VCDGVDTKGVEIIRNVAAYGHDQGTHSYIRYADVRVPGDHLLGERGEGFVVAQTRLGGGRIHHAMRTVGLVRRALEMTCERALSRVTKGEVLAAKQLVQEMIADSWLQTQQFRLLVLHTAWKVDRYDDYSRVRADISAVKAAMPQVLHDVASRALQLHGALGLSDEMPFAEMVLESFHMGLADGATDVHKLNLARQVLKEHTPTDDLFPPGTGPSCRPKPARNTTAFSTPPRLPAADRQLFNGARARRSGFPAAEAWERISRSPSSLGVPTHADDS